MNFLVTGAASFIKGVRYREVNSLNNKLERKLNV